MTELSQNKQDLMLNGTNSCQSVKDVCDRMDKKLKSLKLWHLSPDTATYFLAISGYFVLLKKAETAMQDGDNDLAIKLLSQAESVLDYRLSYIKKVVIGIIAATILLFGILYISHL